MPFVNRSLALKLSVMTVGLMLVVAVSLAALMVTSERSRLLDMAQEMQRVTLRVLATDLADADPGFRYRNDAAGLPGSMVWPSIPDFASHELIDHVTYQTGEVATIFRWDASQGEFVRVTTSVQRPDGTRAVGTVLGQDGAVHAAMMRGETYIGAAEILGRQYLTIHVPTRDAAGAINGVLFAGVGIDGLNSVVATSIRNAALPTLILTAVGGLATMLVLRRSLAPLGALRGAMAAIGAGRHDTTVPATGLRHEVGALARGLERFREHLAEAAAEREARATAERDAAQQAEARLQEQTRVVGDLEAGLRRLADGDLTRAIESPPSNPFPAEYEALRGAYNDALERLSTAMSGVSEVAGALRSSAGEISQAASNLSSRAETQAATLEESAAALNELTESVRSTAERAGAAEKASQDNFAEARSGEEVVREAIAAMKAIERSSEQITRIIGAIDDIAFQTNLLALNAGVEAARAGDAGRGFAVVASEVRALAQRASESAREIKGLISESGSHVETGSTLVARTGESLERILAQASQVSGLMAEIAVAAAEQASGLAEVNGGVAQLDQVTQENAAAAEETTAAAATLNEKASDLTVELASFRLERGNGPAGARGSRPIPALHPATAISPPLPPRQIGTARRTVHTASPAARARDTWQEF